MESVLVKQAIEAGVVVALSIFIVIVVSRLTNNTAKNNQTNMNSLLSLLHEMVTEFNKSLKELNSALHSLKEILTTTNHTIEKQYDGALEKLDEIREAIEELHKNIEDIQKVTHELKAEAPTKIN